MTRRGNFKIVVLPGMDGTGELLTRFLEHLSVCHEVQFIAFLPRASRYSELLPHIVSQLPQERFAIVAESFSGPIAIDIAATDARVAGLVLSSSFASHPWPSALSALVRFLDLAWVPNAIIVAAILGSHGTPDLKARLLRVAKSIPRDVLRSRTTEVLNIDRRTRLREINCPLLCLHGRSDRLVGKTHINAITVARPSCHVQWFDAPHMLLETNPATAADAVSRFCRDLV
ncbi:MAG: alpha/beta hydrolase [Hyphomicrobiaceae bacterium]